MINNRNFVITGLRPWDGGSATNIRHIALELAKNNTVVYINPPRNINEMVRSFTASEERLSTRLKECCPLSRTVDKVAPNLWVVDTPPFQLPLDKITSPDWFDRMNKVNNKLFAMSVKKAVSGLGIKEFIHINDNDIFYGGELRSALKPQLEIYYMPDHIEWRKELRQHLFDVQQQQIRDSDLVFTTTPYLAHMVEDLNRNTYVVGEGVDYTYFNGDRTYPVPEALKDIPRPVVGYTGSLSPITLHADYLFQLARQRPDYSLVLIGAEDKYMAENLLNEMANVYVLPFMPDEQIAAYAAQFDVCVDPQNHSVHNAWRFPIRDFQYLAMGKPVVVTDNPSTRILGDHVAVATDRDQFLSLVDEKAKLPAEDESRRQNREFAYQQTWSASVEKMYGHISESILAGAGL